MIKVTALTGYKSDPCSRFRFRQFIAPLRPLGIEIGEHYLPITRYRRQPLATLGILLRLPGVVASLGGDITWFRRELIPERVTLERFTGGRRIFDVDDAVWLMSERPFSEKIVEMCDGITAGNSFLAEHYRPLGKPVWIVPTVVDTDIWTPGAKTDDGVWRIGWLGTRYNLRLLDLIAEPLADFLTAHRDARLVVVSDGPPDLAKLPADQVEYVKWSASGEIDETRKFDVGLMPLEDNDWSRGKCAAKMICYLAVGVPAVVSPIGVNRDVLEMDQVGFGPEDENSWYEALNKLYLEREVAAEMGLRGRKLVEDHYSVHGNVKKLADIFTKIVNKD